MFSSSAYPYTTVVRLAATFPSLNEIDYFSGVLVAPNEVLTAAHGVWQQGTGAAATVTASIDENGSSFPFGTISAANIHYIAVNDTGGVESAATSQNDYALIHLNQSVTGAGVMQIGQNYAGGTISIDGYPGAGNQPMADGSGTITANTTYTIYTGFISLGAGSSGSPLWTTVNGQATVVGLVSTSGWANMITTAEYNQIEAWIAADNPTTIAAQPPFSATTLSSQPAIASLDGTGVSNIVWENTSGQVVYWATNGTTAPTVSVLAPIVSSDYSIQGVGDLNGSGRSDIIWRSSSTGQLVYWQTNGTTNPTVSVLGAAVPTSYKIVGIGDLNNTGHADIVWESSSGQLVYWATNGTSNPSVSVLGPAVSPDWTVQGIGDLNGSGHADILWRNTNGQLLYWESEGSSSPAIALLGPAVPTDWTVKGLGDLNGTGHEDIVWQSSGGQVVYWQTNGTSSPTVAVLGPAVSPDWSIQAIEDLNGTGKADIVWRNTNGQVLYWATNGTSSPTVTLLGPAVPTNWNIQGHLAS